jgi:hypothetical protein
MYEIESHQDDSIIKSSLQNSAYLHELNYNDELEYCRSHTNNQNDLLTHKSTQEQLLKKDATNETTTQSFTVLFKELVIEDLRNSIMIGNEIKSHFNTLKKDTNKPAYKAYFRNDKELVV